MLDQEWPNIHHRQPTGCYGRCGSYCQIHPTSFGAGGVEKDQLKRNLLKYICSLWTNQVVLLSEHRQSRSITGPSSLCRRCFPTLFYPFCLCAAALCAEVEERLVSHLLSSDRYNKLIRPAVNNSQQVTIYIQVSLAQLINVVRIFKKKQASWWRLFLLWGVGSVIVSNIHKCVKLQSLCFRMRGSR